MAPDSIIFLHLQKTGGTSIRSIIKDNFGGTPKVRGSSGREKDGTWKPLQGSQLDANAWHCHMSFGIHRLIPRPVPYFTIVRDPVAREISRFRHSTWERDRGATPVSSHLPEWGMVYQISGIPYNRLPDLTELHIDLALKNMKDHFIYVGDTSRMDELGLWFRDELGWGLELPLPHKNKAKPEVTVTEEEVEKLKELPGIKLDQIFYDRVCELGPYPQKWML